MNKNNRILISTILFSIFFLILTSLNVFAYFNAYTTESTINMCKCEIKSYSILLENTGEYAESISITYSGTGQNFIRIIPNNVFLKPNEKTQISVFLDSQCKEGDYNVEFYMQSPSIKKVLKQRIIIKPCDILEINLSKSNFTIVKGEQQEVSFSIKNKGTYVEEINFKLDNLKSENFFIEPGQTLKFSVNITGNKIGDFKKQLTVNAFRTGYKKTSNIIVKVIPSKQENALKRAILAIGDFIKQFQKYIIAALIILLIILIILSIGLKKSETKFVEEEKVKGKPERKKETKKEKELKPYYTSVVIERKSLSDFLKRNFKLILIITLLVIIALLVFLTIKYSLHLKIIGFFKTAFSPLALTFSTNKTKTQEGIAEEFEDFGNKQGLFVIEQINESTQNISENITINNISANITPEETEEIVEEEEEETSEISPEEKVVENISEKNLSNDTIKEEIKEEVKEEVPEKKGNIKIWFKSTLTNLKIFFILYLNYIIYGVVALFIIILILNISGKGKKKSKNTKRKKK